MSTHRGTQTLVSFGDPPLDNFMSTQEEVLKFFKKDNFNKKFASVLSNTNSKDKNVPLES